jgi:hypothetical protein
MATPPALYLDTIAIASAAPGAAPAALAAVIATLQVAAATSRERAVGDVVAVGSLAGTVTGATAAARLHPPAGLPFFTADVSAPLTPPRAPPTPWPLQPPLAPLQALPRSPSLAPS